MSTRHCTIGKLARTAGVHVETIRYYQRLGLVDEPKRPPGGIRRYTRAHARRLQFIRKARCLGFSLGEVSELLALNDGSQCREAAGIGSRKLEAVRARIAQLNRIEKTLVMLVSECRRSTGRVRCPLIVTLEDADSGQPIA